MKNSYQFSIEPLHCQGCVNDIKTKLAAHQLAYLDIYQVDLTTKTLQLQLRDAIDEKQLRGDLQRILSNRRLTPKAGPVQHGWAALWGLGAGGLCLLFSLLGWMSLPMVLGFSGLMVWNAWPFIKSAWHQWFSRPRLNMDSLFVLTALFILLSSCASIWSPLFQFSLESGFFIFGFRHLGAKIQAYLDKKHGMVASLVQKFQHHDYLSSDRSTRIKAKDLMLGDRIIGLPEVTLAVDTKVVAMIPATSVLDQLQDGGFLPHNVQIGQFLPAGTKVQTGELELEVVNPLHHSRFADIDKRVQAFESRPNKASILGKTEAWLQWFIPVLLLFALATGVVLTNIYSLAMGLQALTAILVSACPCTLGLIVPMALRMGALKASRRSMYFKSSQALEKAAQIDILVLDYNGTLTLGKPKMSGFQADHPEQAKSLLKAFEDWMLTERPGQLIGLAIAEAVQASAPMHLENFAWVAGGVCASMDGETWWFGNHTLLRSLGLELPQEPHTYYLLDPNKNIYASFAMQDQSRPGMKSLIERFVRKGKQIKVCTGADESTTQAILTGLNLRAEDVASNQSPEDKVQYIKRLAQANPGRQIAMVGDGLNDRLALEQAHLKIWVRHPQLAEEYQSLMQNIADLELDGEHLTHLDHAFDIAAQTYALIRQNLCLSLVYNLAILSCACGAVCMLPPALGVGLMILQSILLTLNTYRTLLQAPPKSETMSLMDLQPA